jgi:hypothetical protein
VKKPQMSPTTIEPIAALEAETDAAARADRTCRQ